MAEAIHSGPADKKPTVTVYVASFNTASATELCIRSLRRFAGHSHSLVVGDSGSTDGTLEMLQCFEGRGWIFLEVEPRGQVHSEWLDHWLETCRTQYAVFVDSDVEFKRPMWLHELIAEAQCEQAALVAAEMLPGIPSYVIPERLEARQGAQVPNFQITDGRNVVRLAARPAPWLLLIEAPSVSPLGVSFAVYLEPDEDNTCCDGFDVGGALFRAVQRAGLRWSIMPAAYGASYHHYGGLSWLPLKGRRGARKALDLFAVRYQLWHQRRWERSSPVN